MLSNELLCQIYTFQACNGLDPVEEGDYAFLLHDALHALLGLGIDEATESSLVKIQNSFSSAVKLTADEEALKGNIPEEYHALLAMYPLY